RAIVALPPLLAGRIAYSPALAAERDQLTQCAPMGSIIKCMALYRTPFWRARGLSGQTFSTSGILISTCDNSPADGQSGILVGLIAGANAEKLRRLSAAERRQTIVVELRQWFGEQAGEPLQYVDRCWEADQWSRGGYFGCFTPGALTAFGEALRKPSGRIHWAGAETAREWLGFIEGAIESGERTAAEVLEADGV
ncbi:MAG: FAD-dependent oxidoreductase, partial [Proteobacteria bacterium]|nr:FAD-dependent oxidoreductase [Pseudomonadota bacterium]